VPDGVRAHGNWAIRRDTVVSRVSMHTGPAAKEAAGMPGRMTKKGKSRCTRTVLRIPDLEQSKAAVLNSLPTKTSQESYAHAIDEFIAWYCSEPRLAFNRPVVL
jgi:hypothetical protein